MTELVKWLVAEAPCWQWFLPINPPKRLGCPRGKALDSKELLPRRLTANVSKPTWIRYRHPWALGEYVLQCRELPACVVSVLDRSNWTEGGEPFQCPRWRSPLLLGLGKYGKKIFRCGAGR